MAGHVYLIDDDAGFRRSLAEIIGSIGLSHDESDSPEQFMSLEHFKRPGCAVIDYRLPTLSGLEVLKSIRTRSSIPVVIISAYADVRLTVAAMQAGAAGVFEKPLDDNEFLGFVEHICFKDRGRIQKRDECRGIQARLADLSDPERKVLDLMLRGQPNKVMASTLDKSVKAIERNRQNVVAKLGCRTAHEVLLKVARCPMMPRSPLTCSSAPCPLSLQQ
ncbi:MAG: response regulator [Sphingomonadales bacterium]|nr:response regulator [Sphingomonadales bacterium]